MTDRDDELSDVKAELARLIAEAIQARGLTQRAAADLFEISQPDVSKIARGKLRPISIERLIACLMALGFNVVIEVEAGQKKRGRVKVVSR